MSGEILNDMFFVPLAAVLGLALGSFINVAIHRLPRMMERQWRHECAWLNGETSSGLGHRTPERYDLIWPPSTCPHCGHRLGWREIIPLLSFLFLRGRCRHCTQRIARRYPLIELASAALLVAIHVRWGHDPWAALVATVFLLTLLTLAAIDLETELLPDSLTLTLLWLGLLVNLNGHFVPLAEAVLGAVSGYILFAILAWVFRRLADKEGMGLGDAKLLAALGAWLGLSALPVLILIASLGGAIAGLVWLKWRHLSRDTPIPFGPFLAVAGAILFWRGTGGWPW